MIRYAARACLNTCKHSRPVQWKPTSAGILLCRTLSTGQVTTAEDVWTSSYAGGERAGRVSGRLAGTSDGRGGRKDTGGDRRGRAPARRRQQTDDFILATKSAQDGFLHPGIVHLMLGGERGLPWSDDAEKVFKVVGKVFKDAKRPNLTLELAKALRDRAGEPFVPSTPGGLVTLLTAMRPYVSAKRQKPSHAQFLDKKVKVTELLGHYKAKGQEVHLMGYRVAVMALRGDSDCQYALDLAREARATCGNSPGLEWVYAHVMEQARENGLPDLMLEVLSEMVEAGGTLTPVNSTYSLVLAGLVKANRAREAMDVYADMEARGVIANKITLSSVLSACARDASYWKQALNIIESMRSREGDEAANVIHYTSAVTSCLKAGKWDETIRLVDQMEEDGVAPSDRLLEHMMQASIQKEAWSWAEGVFRAMTDKYGHGSIVTYQAMWHFVQAMVMQKKLKKAMNCVARVQKFHMRGTRPELTLDTHVLKCFKRIRGVTGEALAGVLMSMTDMGIEIHPDSYSIVIGQANKDGKAELAQTLFQNLLANGQTPSLSSFNAAIKGCEDMGQAEGIMASLKEHKLQPDHVTYSAMLHVCYKERQHGDEKDAEKHVAVDDDGSDNDRRVRNERAKEIWQNMLGQGLAPTKGVLAPYLKALMATGQWEAALEEREAHRNAVDENSYRSNFVAKAGQYLGRTDAVIDGIVCNGLVDNGKSLLAVEHVRRALLQGDHSAGDGAVENGLEFRDEQNQTVLAGIRACSTASTWETALELLEMCEARWATGTRVPGGREEWLAASTHARASRRRLYDAVVCLLDDKGAPWSEIRNVLERGMKNGSVSLVKDSGSRHEELTVDFHLWGIASSRVVLRCILEDLLEGKDFLHSTAQYDLSRFVHAQALREYGNEASRWHPDSPDPRGRRREFAEGSKPSRFAERAYLKGKEKEAGTNTQHVLDPEYWWDKEKRLSIVVGRPRPAPSIRHELEEFCMLRLRPHLRIKTDYKNTSVLTLDPAEIRAWVDHEPIFLERGEYI